MLKQIEVGDTVFWYSSLEAHARPWPAVVLNVNAGNSLDLNVHQNNRLMLRESTLHRSEPTLVRWSAADITHQGVWEAREERAKRLPPEPEAKPEVAGAQKKEEKKEVAKAPAA